MTRRMDHRSWYLFMEVGILGSTHVRFAHPLSGHTARPTDFCWAPGVGESWTAASTSEDNILMVWQPTMRIWAGDEVKVDERELEGEAMEGIETIGEGADVEAGPSA